MSGLSVYSMIVSCPHKDCDSLQTVPLKHWGSEVGSSYSYSSARNYKCTNCGRILEVNGTVHISNIDYE